MKPFEQMTDAEKLKYLRACVLSASCEGLPPGCVLDEVEEMRDCLGITDADVEAFAASCGKDC